MSAIGLIVFLIAAALLFKVFFDDKEDFFDCLKYYLTPDIWSLFKGQYHQDFFAEGKLFLWFGVSALLGFGAHQLVH